MKLAALQSEIVWESPEANFERLAPRVAAAAAAGARLVALPEMFACGFSMETGSICEPPGGPSTEFLSSQARAHGVWICGSIPELRPGADKPRNTALVVSPEGEIHRYDKIHPFSFAGEDEHYTAGDQFQTVAIEGVRVTVFICYDLRFADEFWATADRTDLYLVIANWPERRSAHWSTLLRARAIENQAYVAGVNRVGAGGQLQYSGDSAIIDPWGSTLVEARGDETMLLADVDAARVADARTRFPVAKDRR